MFGSVVVLVLHTTAMTNIILDCAGSEPECPRREKAFCA